MSDQNIVQSQSTGRRLHSYDFEFKKKAVERVLAGENVKAVCASLQISAVSTVHGWVYRHKAGGLDALPSN